jgi:hypothetical protein
VADRVYLDWNATAPLRPEARAAMAEAMEIVGNPSSVHAEGRAARGAVERARAQVAAALGAEGADIVFTSGATEAAALALAGRGLRAVNRHVAGDKAHPSTEALIAAMSDAPSMEDRATADLYCQLLGRVLGDLALIHLPFGGIYLIGGLARAMAPFFEAHGLAEAFRDKGRFATFMDAFALLIVEDDYAALTGCARYVRRQKAAAGA